MPPSAREPTIRFTVAGPGAAVIVPKHRPAQSRQQIIRKATATGTIGEFDSVAEGDRPGHKTRRTVTAKYECTACGYIYDPAEGDPDGGVPAGTAFKDIPDDWVCPDCGLGKEDFTELA